MIDDAEMVWPAIQLHWTRDDRGSHDVLHCCHAMCLHCCLVAAAANDSADDFVGRPANVLAAKDHYSIVVLDALAPWHEDMQSNCFCGIEEKKSYSFS